MKTQKELEKLITEANEAYRSGNSLISDREFDALMDELRENYPESKILQKSVQEIKIERKVKLPHRMTSLDKLKSVEEVMNWISKYPEGSSFVLMAKLDGISLLTEYNNCYTRGDGEIGQQSDDWYSEMNTTKSNYMTVGEAIMKNTVFNENYLTQGFKTARNTVAGLFNAKSPSPYLMDVDYVRFGVCNTKLTKLEQLQLLENEKLNVVDFISIKKEDITVETLNHYRELWGKTYKIDGLVIEINQTEKETFESNGNPTFAKAIKLPEWSCNAVVEVKGVTFKVSKQGKLKPVINIEPTEIDGVVVSNVTGYNMSYLVDNTIAKDSKIVVVRSGDVIPKHIGTKQYNINELESLCDEAMICPSCGNPTVWDKTFTELLCENKKCKGIKLAKFEHFFSTLEFEEFSDQSINQLFNEGVNSLYEFFELEKEDLTVLDGWGSKMADNYLKQIEKLEKEGVSLAKFLHSLDIFQGKIGETDCQLILDNIKTEDMFLMKNLTDTELTSIPGIGEVKAKSFIEGIKSYFIEGFNSIPVKINQVKTPKIEQTGGLFENQKVCVTGFRDLNIQHFIESNGGKIMSGVSKKTDLLIVEDMSTTSTKAQKARENNIKIISRFEIEQMMD